MQGAIQPTVEQRNEKDDFLKKISNNAIAAKEEKCACYQSWYLRTTEVEFLFIQNRTNFVLPLLKNDYWISPWDSKDGRV